MSRSSSRRAAALSAPLPPALRLASALVHRARLWPIDSQQAARRNAMLACTALAVRRAERADVEDYFRTHSDAPSAAHG